MMMVSCGKSEKENSTAESGTKRISHSRPISGERKREVTAPVKRVKRFLTIRDIDGRRTEISIARKGAVFKKITQPIVVLSIMASWCPPCRAMLPYMSELQKSYAKSVFFIGILANDRIDDEELRELMVKYDTTFFISNSEDNDEIAVRAARIAGRERNFPMPLTLIFARGTMKYQISGAIPYEMLENIINQLQREVR